MFDSIIPCSRPATDTEGDRALDARASSNGHPTVLCITAQLPPVGSRADRVLHAHSQLEQYSECLLGITLVPVTTTCSNQKLLVQLEVLTGTVNHFWSVWLDTIAMYCCGPMCFVMQMQCDVTCTGPSCREDALLGCPMNKEMAKLVLVVVTDIFQVLPKRFEGARLRVLATLGRDRSQQWAGTDAILPVLSDFSHWIQQNTAEDTNRPLQHVLRLFIRDPDSVF